MNQELKIEFLKAFPVPVGKKEKPYIILFDAYTGMGKSTVTKEIAKYDKSIILNNDEVRTWLTNHNEKEQYKELQNYRLEKLLKNKLRAIFRNHSVGSKTSLKESEKKTIKRDKKTNLEEC